MKMINSTSVMSTNGVTLIPTIAPPRGESEPAMLVALARKFVTRDRPDMCQEHVSERFGVAEGSVEQSLKVVEYGDSGDRHAQADSGRHQCFGDGAHDAFRSQAECASARRCSAAELLESAHDADHRAEQANEGRITSHRAEEQQS